MEDQDEELAEAEAEPVAVLTNLSNKLSLQAPCPSLLILLSNNNLGFGAIFGFIKYQYQILGENFRFWDFEV